LLRQVGLFVLVVQQDEVQPQAEALVAQPGEEERLLAVLPWLWLEPQKRRLGAVVAVVERGLQVLACLLMS